MSNVNDFIYQLSKVKTSFILTFPLLNFSKIHLFTVPKTEQCSVFKGVNGCLKCGQDVHQVDRAGRVQVVRQPRGGQRLRPRVQRDHRPQRHRQVQHPRLNLLRAGNHQPFQCKYSQTDLYCAKLVISTIFKAKQMFNLYKSAVEDISMMRVWFVVAGARGQPAGADLQARAGRHHQGHRQHHLRQPRQDSVPHRI